MLPKLEIRSPEGAWNLKQLEVLLDGHQLPGLQSVRLYLEPDEVNRLSVEIAVSEVTIDPQTYVLLQAYVQEEKEG